MSTPPFEYLPGRWADDALVRWRHAPTRPSHERLVALSTSASAPRRGESAKASVWDRRAAIHVARRLGFGATPEVVNALAALTQTQAVNAILDAARDAPALADPAWIGDAPPPPGSPPATVTAYVQANRDRIDEVEWGVYLRMMGDGEADPIQALGLALRERLALVWHDHFVTEVGVYQVAPWLHRYWATLRDGALGDVRALTHAVGLTPAMLVYLNGADNRAGNPNENYARELMELFTMGILGPDGSPNYTEADVQELARALTGWSVDLYGDLGAHFVPEWHDTGSKTILGLTGAWSYDDVVPLLFEQRPVEIATYLCRTLYRAFVYAEPSANVVNAMANVLIAADWQIEAVLRELFASPHFISENVMGARIASPVESAVGLFHSARRTPDPRRRKLIRDNTTAAGQSLFNPPDVSGWPGHRAWMDTSRLAARWHTAERILQTQTDLRAVALAMPHPYVADTLVAELADLFLGLPLDPVRLGECVDLLLGGAPATSWDPTEDGAEARLVGLVAHFTTLPEHELI